MRTLIRLHAGGAIAAAAPAESQTHVLDPGVTYSTGEISSHVTTGADMIGMLVTPHLERGDSFSLTWDHGRDGRCGAFHEAFSLSMDCAGDTLRPRSRSSRSRPPRGGRRSRASC